MFAKQGSLLVAVLVGVFVLGTPQPSPARGRSHHYYHAGRRSGYRRGYGSAGPGGYLSGAANVINAQGRYLVNTQQAYLLKEQVRAAMLKNRRLAFDEHLYERSLTPTLNDRRFLEQQEELRRALTHPPETEIWSGKTLNDLLAHLQDLRNRGEAIPHVPLDPEAFRHINLTVRSAGNIGLLKTPGPLNWPAGLQKLEPRTLTAQQCRQIDALLSQARDQASRAGRVDATITDRIAQAAAALRDRLVLQVGEYSFADYTQAKNYLTRLDGAVTVLKQPDVANYFNGKYRPHGESVDELVKYLTENGLKFAPALPGEEAAYSGLCASLTECYLGSGATAPNESELRRFYRGLYEKTQTYQQHFPPLP